MSNNILNNYEDEIWIDVRGFEGEYQVSNFGRVRSLDRFITYEHTNQYNYRSVVTRPIKGRILTPRKNKDNRNRVQLNNKDYYIYKLVAANFIRPLLEKEEVNHMDGNHQNDRLDNLEICTRIENQNHAYDNNLNTYFEKAIKVKVNDIIYNSLGEAAKESGIPKAVLWKKLKNPDIKNRKYKFTIEKLN